MVLRVLLYGMTDAEVKYACTEMLEHMGLPYAVIDDLSYLKSKSCVSDVLIIPESSLMEADEAEAVRKSKCSVLLTGSVPERLWDYLGCRAETIMGKSPPKISGLFRIDKIGAVPFFYEFPVLRCVRKAFESLAVVENERGKYMGAVMVERDGRCLAVVAPQIFRSATYLLSGGEATLPLEQQRSLGLIDKYGRIDGKKTEIYKKGFLYVPIVNMYEKSLFQIFLELSSKKGIPLIYKWFYPGNYDMAVCSTHEVEYAMSPITALDAVYSFKVGAMKEGVTEIALALIAFFSSILSKLRIFERKNSLRLLPKFVRTRLMQFNPIWNFGWYVDVERRFGVTSSFYFLMNRTRRDSDYDFENPLIKAVITSLKKNGWEIGLHASFYSYINSDMLKEEKFALEKVLGKKTVGVRQHFNRMTIPNTWECQEKAGFLYDTTFGYAQEVGFAAGSCLPFMPWNHKSQKRVSILEVPLIITDGTLFQKHHLALQLEEAWELCKKLIDIIHEYNGTLTLSWHSSLDRKRYRPWFKLYKKILAYSSIYNPWYTNGEKLAEWWNLRRSIFLEEGTNNKTAFRFHINSPNQCYISLGAFIPQEHGNIELFVNGTKLDGKAIVRKGNMLLLLFSVPKGETIVEIQLRGR